MLAKMVCKEWLALLTSSVRREKIDNMHNILHSTVGRTKLIWIIFVQKTIHITLQECCFVAN